MRKWFDHVGIPLLNPSPDELKLAREKGEIWVEETQVWITNPRLHPKRIEYVRPEVPPQIDSRNIGLWKLWHLPHIAYRVDDIDEAMEREEIILGPFRAGNFATVVFVHKDGAVIEYIEYFRLDVWFVDQTPWKEAGPPTAPKSLQRF